MRDGVKMGLRAFVNEKAGANPPVAAKPDAANFLTRRGVAATSGAESSNPKDVKMFV